MPSVYPDLSYFTKKIEMLNERIKGLESLTKDYECMLEKSFDGLAIVDSDTRILFLNQAFERIMGIKRSEIIGKRQIDLIKAGYFDITAAIKVMESGKPETVIINTKAGKQALCTGIPVFDEMGNLIRIYCNLRDVTELIELKENHEHSRRASCNVLELQELKRTTILTDFIVKSKEMQEIIDQVFKIASFDTTVLLVGESGVGKSVIAKIIHESSKRAQTGRFIKINCGAIPENLLESELFGYMGGAFTDAKREGKPGYFELANKGTICLDEIAELPLRLQVKLLDILEDHEFARLGDIVRRKVDARIIAATNQNIDEMVNEGGFRKDLFYRLNVVRLCIPPLRERIEEVPSLVTHFLKRYNEKYNTKRYLNNEVLDIFMAYPWPGNIRELSNLIEYLVLTTKEEEIKAKDLPGHIIKKKGSVVYGSNKGNGDGQIGAQLALNYNLKRELKRYEIELIRKAVKGHKTLEEAAASLGISMSTLLRRIKEINNTIITGIENHV
jgi:PAS domain S-box-containing protein